VIVGGSGLWVDLDRLLVLGARLDEIALVVKNFTQIHVGFKVIGVKLQRFTKLSNAFCPVRASLFQECCREPIMSHDKPFPLIIGQFRRSQGGAIFPDGLAEMPLPLKYESQCTMSRTVLGAESNGCPISRCGTRNVALISQRIPQPLTGKNLRTAPFYI